MKISLESGVLLAANIAVGVANIYLNPRSAVLSLIFGMAIGSYNGSNAVAAALSTDVYFSNQADRTNTVNGLLNALPKYGTLFLGASALFASMNRIGTTQLLGTEQNAMSLNMIVLGYFLGKSFKIKELYDQVQIRLTARTITVETQTRLASYRDAII
jgi:hypothetical protein